MTDVFRFLPGEKVLQIVGMPGPDTDDCEIIDDDGGATVRIRFQVYGSGQVYEEDCPRSRITWLAGSDTSARHAKWKPTASRG